MDRDCAGNCILLKQLGRGGQGEIYLAWDEEKSSYTAVKRFESRLLEGIREARILESLCHPGIPKYLGRRLEDGHLDLFMEYIPGISVKEYIRLHEKIPERRTAVWGIQLLDILDYLHRRSPPVIHCDIKPSNLIITRRGRLFLIDYGTAVLGKDGNQKLGTCGYAAPEQMDGLGYADEQSDIYSFGMTLYHMVTGHHPGKKPWEDDKNYGFSRGFARVLKKCIRTDKEDRYQTVSEVRRGLKRVLRKRAAVWAGAAVSLILAAGVCWKSGYKKEQPAYGVLLAKAEEERSKAGSRFSMKAVRYYELAVDREPDQAAAYERLLRYYQSAGREKEGLTVLAEYVESKDFDAVGKDKLLFRMGLLYLQGKEGKGGFPPDPVLAYRYLAMQEHPTDTQKDYTELAGILSGKSCQGDRLWRILDRCGQKTEDFQQAYLLFQICRQKEQELKKYGDAEKKQEELADLMEKLSENNDEKRTALYEKAAFYERMIDSRGLEPWIEAADRYTDMLDREKEKAELQLKKAGLLAVYGRKKSAEEVHRAVIRQYSGWPEGYIAYGFYLAKAGKRDMAQDMYRRAKGLGAGEGTELQKLGAVLGEGND